VCVCVCVCVCVDSEELLILVLVTGLVQIGWVKEELRDGAVLYRTGVE
jgi:hypothetical protein